MRLALSAQAQDRRASPAIVSLLVRHRDLARHLLAPDVDPQHHDNRRALPITRFSMSSMAQPPACSSRPHTAA
jgi:hypothetical protein